MDKTRIARCLPLVLLVLTACGGGGGGLCSATLKGQLAPTCSPVSPGPSVNPVGSWQGTFTTTTSGSKTELFNAEITEAEAEDGGYTGVFKAGDRVYNVTGYGYYDAANDENFFTFRAPFEDVKPALSEPRFYGTTWSGTLTETRYSGNWDFTDETDTYVAGGTFKLERLP